MNKNLHKANVNITNITYLDQEINDGCLGMQLPYKLMPQLELLRHTVSVQTYSTNPQPPVDISCC